MAPLSCVTDRSRGSKRAASAGLAALVCAALASCGGPVAPSGGQAAANAPDLVVTLAARDGGPVAGARFTLTATVRNSGGAAAAATTLRYFRSTDATITTTDEEVGTDAVAAIAASGAGTASEEVPAPSTPGTYYYGACVGAVANESDTTNNCSASVQVTVQAAGSQPQGDGDDPDLTVLSASVNDDGPVIGAPLTLSATVRNAGGRASEATELRYYRSPDATISPADTHLGTEPIAELAGDGSAGTSLDLTAPATPGTHYYGACVQAVTGESDTTNNCSPSVQVTALVQARESQGDPDLVVTSPSVSDSVPAAGATFTLSATARNDGDGAAAATTLRFYRSADSTITTSDSEVGTDAVDALPAYGSSAESISLTAPATTGAYYYGACVDAVAGEADTTNNCSVSVKVDVVAQQRRVDISPRTLTFEAVGDSETVTVRVLDENGDEDTDASYVWITISGPGTVLHAHEGGRRSEGHDDQGREHAS